jgi:hypothetical protein
MNSIRGSGASANRAYKYGNVYRIAVGGELRSRYPEQTTRFLVPYRTLLTGVNLDLVAFVDLPPQTETAHPFEIAVNLRSPDTSALGELLLLDWQVARDDTGLEALPVCQPLGVWTYSGGASVVACLEETPRLPLKDWLRRSEEQGDPGLIQRLSRQMRRPDLGQADRAEGTQTGGGARVILRPIKSLYTFRAWSTGQRMPHELKEKPVEPRTLRQPEKKPTGRTTPPKPKKTRITGMASPRLKKVKKNRVLRTKSGASQESVSTRRGSPEDVPPALRIACEALDFGDLRRFIDDCLDGQENERGLDCSQSEEEFLGLLEILRAKAGELTPLPETLPNPGRPHSFPPRSPYEQLQALRAEQRRLEAALRAAEDDPAATKRSIIELHRELKLSAAEVTALKNREKKEYAKRRDAYLRSYREAKAAYESSVRRRKEALREQHQDRMRWHRRTQIVERVERDIRRAFKFGTARPTGRLPWRLLPPGELTIERLRSHYKGLQYRNPHVRYDVERLEKAVSLEPEACYVGTDEFEGYVVFTFAQTQRALLECPIYGNAIYVLGPDWRRLSKMSKQELLSGRLGGVTKIVHRGDWFKRARLTLGLR